MNKSMRSVSKILAGILVFTSTMLDNPICTYAEGNNKNESRELVKKKEVAKIKEYKGNREKTEIIIKYKTNGKQRSVASAINGKQKLKKFEVKKSFNKSRVDLVEIDENDDMDETLSELRKNPNVEYAQPNYKLEILSDPVDARFIEQWGLYYSGQDIECYPGRS